MKRPPIRTSGVGTLSFRGFHCMGRRCNSKGGVEAPARPSPGESRSDALAGDIDDGYWQGVPVGGIGAGTFSRSYRGDFARWHIKAARSQI